MLKGQIKVIVKFTRSSLIRSESQNSNECQLSPTYLTLEERCVVPEEVKEVESDSSESFYSEIIA